MAASPCALISRQRDEPLMGTAARVDVWFLLTHAGPWGAKALPESHLPEAVKERLQALAESVPDSRVLLIKRSPQGERSRPVLHVALSHLDVPLCYEIPLPSTTDLLDLDLAPYLSGDPAVLGQAISEPLFLACTNGKRDPCCARDGLPVYRALREAAGPAAWQCSHVGGHRFAANVVVLPHGLYYGRITAPEAAQLVSVTRQGRLLLPHLRGRSSYPPAVQAAEILLRERLGVDDINHFQLLEAAPLTPDRWQVTFLAPPSGERHRLTVGLERSPDLARVSCQGDKQAPITRYHLEHYQQEET